jgi:hypothetical protein
LVTVKVERASDSLPSPEIWLARWRTSQCSSRASAWPVFNHRQGQQIGGHLPWGVTNQIVAALIADVLVAPFGAEQAR